jgi:hypothetical protein
MLDNLRIRKTKSSIIINADTDRHEMRRYYPLDVIGRNRISCCCRWNGLILWRISRFFSAWWDLEGFRKNNWLQYLGIIRYLCGSSGGADIPLPVRSSKEKKGSPQNPHGGLLSICAIIRTRSRPTFVQHSLFQRGGSMAARLTFWKRKKKCLFSVTRWHITINDDFRSPRQVTWPELDFCCILSSVIEA